MPPKGKPDASYASALELSAVVYCFFSILAQVSLSVTVRLNTGRPGVPSGSAPNKLGGFGTPPDDENPPF